MKQMNIKFLKNIDATDKSGIKNMLLKPFSMIISLLYTPLLLSYLGDEQYGLWATVLSVISWINYFDLGIGLGLRNLLTKELTEQQYEKAKKSVSTAYIVLGMISGILLLALIVMVFVLNWREIFNTTIDMRYPLLITFVFLVVNFVLALSNTLLYALHLSEQVAFRNCLVQLMNLLGLIILKATTQPSLIYMSILFGITSSIIYVANSIKIFSRHNYLCPSVRCFEKKKISEITKVGFKFFGIQLSGLLLYSVDRLIVTHFFGPAEVTDIDVANKIFSLGATFLAALMVPYLSRTTEALEKGNISWIRTAIKKMYTVYGLCALAYVVLAIFFEPLAKIYVGKDLDFQPGLILTMCLYYLFYSFVTVNTPFINGTGKLNGQLILSLSTGALSIPLAIFLGVNCGMGPVGVKLSTVIMLFIGAVFYPINLQCILRKEEKRILE